MLRKLTVCVALAAMTVMMRTDENIREQLLAYVPWFVTAAAKLAGVRRIALLGSITTEKKDPKDIDFLVTVDDEVDLEPLARLGRKLKGRTQQINHGADIFLADVQEKYIGRTCHWKECWAGRRRSCDALNCGRRQYLHDDLNTVRLSEETLSAALELWPVLERREGLPGDLAEVVGKIQVDSKQ
jgi:predicted nucleotidyltransferase